MILYHCYGQAVFKVMVNTTIEFETEEGVICLFKNVQNYEVAYIAQQLNRKELSISL